MIFTIYNAPLLGNYFTHVPGIGWNGTRGKPGGTGIPGTGIICTIGKAPGTAAVTAVAWA